MGRCTSKTAEAAAATTAARAACLSPSKQAGRQAWYALLYCCLAWSNASTWFIAAVEMTTSSNTGTEPPTNPVLPPCVEHAVSDCHQGRAALGSGSAGTC